MGGNTRDGSTPFSRILKSPRKSGVFHFWTAGRRARLDRCRTTDVPTDEGPGPAGQPGGGRRRGRAGRPDRARDAGPARCLASATARSRPTGSPRRSAKLRIFDDAEGRMNEPLGEREVLCVSQFTLYGDAAPREPAELHRRRPGEVAEPLYDRFCERLGAKKGVFGACMGVALVNDGPVTLMLEVALAPAPSPRFFFFLRRLDLDRLRRGRGVAGGVGGGHPELDLEVLPRLADQLRDSASVSGSAAPAPISPRLWRG